MVRPARGALYDSRSLAWRLNSRWMVMLGGQRAAIMQISDPRVAAGVKDYSTYRTDPLGRLQRTMDYMMIIGFGDPDQRQKVLDDLDRVHARVKGRTDEGKPYSALDPKLMYWVLATLTDTVMEVDRRYVGRLREADRERYYDETRVIASAFGIDDRFIPDDYPAFKEYMAERVEKLRPSAASREIARGLLQPGIAFIPNQVFVPLDWVTLELLPSQLRDRLHLGVLNPMQLAAVRGARGVARGALQVAPRQLTANPFAIRALRKAA
ncbi:MAG: oxygenase MpaB family protein [Microthrixaceae bacterium]